MGKKVLFIATVDSHIELFHLPFLKMFKDKGYEVSVATETNRPIKYCDKKIKLPIKRSPFKVISNFKAIRKLKKILAEEKYEIMHCHTPVGGVVARMAAKKARKNGTRVIYTAHGFHFYKGAPMHFWMMFYPIEWYLARFTDTLITINNEDFERAKKRFGKRCRDIQYVPGVGVDPKKFEKKLTKKEKAELRKSLGLSGEDKVLICIGRLDKNKNQGFLIRAMRELLKKDDKYHLLLVGPDELNGKYQKLAKKLGVEKNVHFLGFRKDISELLQISDVAVSASKREGLPVNLIEAGMLGVPIVATDCRGNRDVCKKVDGVVSAQGDLVGFSADILSSERSKIGKIFVLQEIEQKMNEIYINNPNAIDFVVLWVDGSDPKWLAKKKKYKPELEISDIAARYRDWGLFKYWFRAVEKYAPWVNHVYLVTDDQRPEWIDENNSKLTIIDHREILKPENIPNYNASAIEINLHRIPNLSERFVYFNDDMFLVNEVKPDDFFKKGLPVEVANINAATGMEGDQQFAQMMFNDILLINRHFKKKEVVHKNLLKWINPKYGFFNVRTLSQMIYPYFTGYKAHHIAAPFLKSTFDKVWTEEQDILEKTSSHRFRHPEDANQYVFIQWQLCENNFIPKKVSKGAHLKLAGIDSIKSIKRAIKSKKRRCICINEVTDRDLDGEIFDVMKNRLIEIFDSKLPEKSSYEK